MNTRLHNNSCYKSKHKNQDHFTTGPLGVVSHAYYSLKNWEILLYVHVTGCYKNNYKYSQIAKIITNTYKITKLIANNDNNSSADEGIKLYLL